MRGECWANGFLIKMSPAETAIIERLLLAGPRSTSVTELIEWVWPNPDKEPEHAHNVLRVYMVRLKRKGFRIEARPSFGYRLLDAERPGCQYPKACKKAPNQPKFKLCISCSNTIRNQKTKAEGLTKTQAEVWEFIRCHRDCRIEQIMEHFQKNYATIWKQIKALVNKGLLYRTKRLQKPRAYFYTYRVNTSNRLLARPQDMIEARVHQALGRVDRRSRYA